MQQFDLERLRKDLKDYYGTAMFNGNPAALMELSHISGLSNEEILDFAKKIGMNLDKYRLKAFPERG